MVAGQGKAAANEALRVPNIGGVEVKGGMSRLSGAEVEGGPVVVDEFIVPCDLVKVVLPPYLPGKMGP